MILKLIFSSKLSWSAVQGQDEYGQILWQKSRDERFKAFTANGRGKKIFKILKKFHPKNSVKKSVEKEIFNLLF